MALFDLSTVETQEFKPLKPGKYIATVTEAKVEPLYSGKGTKLAITIKIVDGDFKNRIIYHSFNVKHENETAQKIGQQQLKSLMICLGIGSVLENTSELLGKPFNVVTSLENDQNGTQRARVKYFEPSDYKMEDSIPF